MNANGLEPAKLDEFAKWVEQRDTVAGQTTALASTTTTFRSW
jgi:hypothetical protein